MNRRSKTLAGAGAVTIAVTVIVSCLCIEDWGGITPFGLALMVWAELALFGGLILTERISERTGQIILRTSYFVIFSVYSVCAFIASVFFINWFKDSAKNFLIVHLILAAVAAILLMVFYSTSKSVYEAQMKTEDTARQIRGYVNRLLSLAAGMEESEFVPAVKKAAEELRFTDLSVIVSVDAEIEKAISELEKEFGSTAASQSFEKLRERTAELERLITRRKTETAAAKRGGM